jgi:hypothetical protein
MDNYQRKRALGVDIFTDVLLFMVSVFVPVGAA